MNKIIMNDDKKMESSNYSFSNNKVIIDHDGILTFNIKDFSDKVKVIVTEGVSSEIILFGENVDTKVELILEKNSKLSISSFLINGNGEVITYLNGENAELSFILGNLCTENTVFRFCIYHRNPKTVSNLFIHGLSLNKANINFDVNGVVEKTSSGCSCFQDSKIIHLEKSESRIDPNLYIENYDVEASHAAYIGSFSEEELFYLMSRGLSRRQSYSLLMHSFLFGKMQLSEEVRNKWIQQVEMKFE